MLKFTFIWLIKHFKIKFVFLYRILQFFAISRKYHTIYEPGRACRIHYSCVSPRIFCYFGTQNILILKCDIIFEKIFESFYIYI